MRARRLHATSLGSGAELPRNELIAALTPQKRGRCFTSGPSGPGPISCRPRGNGGYGSCLQAVASARREPARK